jgi:opacity protein-like surface antigen
MILKPTLFLLVAALVTTKSFAQDEDLLKGLGEGKPQKEYVSNSFKSSRVIMSHSVEMLRPGVLDFRILHRFGNVNQGLSEFFGLDQATIRLGLDYGISDHLTVGIGRGSLKKEIDGFLKWRAVQQATGPGSLPFSLVAVAGSTIIGSPWSDPARENHFSSRVGYYGQAIIGRKFSENLTLQLMPTMLHRNFVETKADPNDLYATGIGGRIKLTKRISLNVDYYYVINQNDLRDVHNPLSIGFDIETGGHVFQLHFTNAVGMNERVFLTETTNDWANGDIQFGFNISRSFQIGKRKK